jgi:hypothetical protein
MELVNEADKAACAFAASSAYRLSNRKAKISDRQYNIVRLDRLLKRKRKLRKL